MEPFAKRGRFQETTQSRQSDRGFRALQNLDAELDRLLQRLESLEVETAASLQETSDHEIKQKFKRMRSQMETLIRDELSRLLASPCEPVEVAQGVGCCVLQATTTHGRDVASHNREYRLLNHIDMVTDNVRVSAFQSAISRCAKGKHVLDVGTGAFCLLARMAVAAGAWQVDAVEINEGVATHAAKLLRYEADRRNLNIQDAAAIDEELARTVPLLRHRHMPSLQVVESTLDSGCEPRGTRKDADVSSCYTVSALSGGVLPSRICLYSSPLESASLSGPYHLVLHELLGHIASSEGVMETLTALRRRSLCADSCTFIPCAAGTLFAPTSRVELATPLEKVMHCFFNAGTRIQAHTKYHAKHFDAAMLMARPRYFEYLQFSMDGLSESQHADATASRRRVVFITERAGLFDGLHFHLHVQLDESTEIDTLDSATTWSTTYVKLLESGVHLPEGARIVCDCESGSRSGMPQYSVKVCVGEPWDEREIACFSWEGAT